MIIAEAAKKVATLDELQAFLKEHSLYFGVTAKGRTWRATLRSLNFDTNGTGRTVTEALVDAAENFDRAGE